MIATVTIDRSSPESIDPAFSSRGHEATINSYRIRKADGLEPWIESQDEIARFIATHAPEAITPRRIDQWSENDEHRTQYWIIANDHRGYFTTVTVDIDHDSTADQAHARYATYLAKRSR